VNWPNFTSSSSSSSSILEYAQAVKQILAPDAFTSPDDNDTSSSSPQPTSGCFSSLWCGGGRSIPSDSTTSFTKKTSIVEMLSQHPEVIPQVAATLRTFPVLQHSGFLNYFAAVQQVLDSNSPNGYRFETVNFPNVDVKTHQWLEMQKATTTSFRQLNQQQQPRHLVVTPTPKPEIEPPLDAFTFRGFWWGFELYIPSKYLNNIDDVMYGLEAINVALTVLSIYVLVLQPLAAALTGYVSIEYGLIKSKKGPNGVVIEALWVLPILFWPRPWGDHPAAKNS